MRSDLVAFDEIETVLCVDNAECPDVCVSGACTQRSAVDGPCDETDDCAADSFCGGGLCRLPDVCGNGLPETGEVCDDGNTLSEAACDYGIASCTTCNADCSAELNLSGGACGDGSTDTPDEVCDDGFAVNSDAWSLTEHCNANCTGRAPYCGDGVTNGGGEACDDGAGTNSDDWAFESHCSSSCTGPGPFCGDGLTDPTNEVCDDGVGTNSNAWALDSHCDAGCDGPGPFCGDGVVQSSNEGCDDGGSGDGDGCDSSCQEEIGWSCLPGDPSVCNPTTTPGFALITPGTFMMGEQAGEVGSTSPDPQIEVTLTRSFWIQETETTQQQFETLMGGNPSYFSASGAGTPCGSDCPVEAVGWFGAVAYMNELSLSEGRTPCYIISDVVCVIGGSVAGDYSNCYDADATRGGISSASVALNGASSVYDCAGYRLPTEAEWEYAARAEDTRATYNGELTAGTLVCEQPNATLDPVAWFCGNSISTTQPVASAPGPDAANAYGLYDMLGNVWEWCWDWHEAPLVGPVTDPEGATTGSSRILRGGTYSNHARFARAGYRFYAAPGLRTSVHGFRAARTATE